MYLHYSKLFFNFDFYFLIAVKKSPIIMQKHFAFTLLFTLTVYTIVSMVGCSKKGDTTPTLATININTITKISATSATVTGVITSNGNSTITESGVCYSTTVTPDITKSKVVKTVSGGTFTCLLTGLNPETTYYVRAYATNATGTAYGNELPFLTASVKFWIPDAIFRSTLKLLIPAAFDSKDSLKTTNSSVKGFNGTIDITSKGIVNLSGIEYFTSIKQLSCSSNSLATLDVSKNIALTSLMCSNNLLTGLDVTKNTALSLLACYSNQLTTLDVSKNTALTFLDCDNNNLATLDLSKNNLLSSLFCYANLLTNLDISTLNTVPDNLYIITDNATLANNGNTNLVTLKVNTALQQLSEIKNIKTTRTGCTISTRSNGVQVCGNYNPVTNTCP